MPLYYTGLRETVNAESDNPVYVTRFRPRVERGITIYRIDGLWYTGRDLAPEELVNADRVYRGGYVYDVPDDELAEMEAQGIHASEARDLFTDTFTETF